MKGSTKVWLIVAVCLMAAGLVVSTIGLEVLGYDFTKLGTQNMQTNTYTPEGEFSQIRVETDVSNIRLALSEDGSCKVVCREDEKMPHTVRIQNGALVIHQENERKWFDYIGINLGSQDVTVYLPESSYESLKINTDTGNIQMPKTLAFQDADIQASTGNVQWETQVNGKLNVQTSTGNVSVTGVICTDLGVNTDTGNVMLTDMVAAGKMSVETSTGNVMFKKADAGEIRVMTSTGDVEGTLLTEKIFVTETSTGDVDVPKTTFGGKCRIETTTGDIEITIE